jgi:porphobilinogen deaminase
VRAAFPERGDPRDVLVGATLDALPTGATVATGSARRRVQLANLRPDLTFADLRGNLATRVSRVGADGIAAVVAARAALDRLDWRAPVGVAVETLEPGTMLPQVAQGALAVECRADDDVTRTALAAIDDVGVRSVVEAERAFLAELGGGCTLPVGAHAVFDAVVDPDPSSDGRAPAGPASGRAGPAGGTGPGTRLRLTGLLAGADGHVVLRHGSTGLDGPALGRAVARYLLDDAGGADLGPWSPGS